MNQKITNISTSINDSNNCFTPFIASTKPYSLPTLFTFPFYYQPHPLCVLAAQELQDKLAKKIDWQNSFGLTKGATASGKMFGVLLVHNEKGELGYLSAFSGQMTEQDSMLHFVPPVCDDFATQDLFIDEQKQINGINKQIEVLENSSELLVFKAELLELEQQLQREVELGQQRVIQGRKQRKAQRLHALENFTPADILLLNESLAKESVNDKNQLKALKNHWQEQLNIAANKVNQFVVEIEQLKTSRKTRSATLQQQLFSQYRFLNNSGQEKNLLEIFKNTIRELPPAGAGDCAAPKLLQYAFKNQLTPLALAEFWWGASPKSQIRQHKNFYPSCLGKCQPILSHMLAGMELEVNPLLTNPAQGKTLDIIYQDEAIVIINKPAEFLSVPGKNIEDSVLARMRAMFPEHDSPFIVHRLDMSTSGLMVIALSKRAHKHLQQQFINRTVEKHYVAVVSGILTQEQGVITLPLRGDFDDRPRQLVCHQYGKTAHTTWQVIERFEKVNQGSKTQAPTTKIQLVPKTGRTHQLRVHCAHVDGLNMPIVGDDLYGNKANRLHLHAAYLALQHPLTKKQLVFEVAEEF
jgi:tRNA pseudouridine32 synthase/23S rRNA pseudouridine746 synthase